MNGEYKIPKRLQGLARFARKFTDSEKFVNAVWMFLNVNPKTEKEYTHEERMKRKHLLPKTTADLGWFEINHSKQTGRNVGWFTSMAEFWEVSKRRKK
jgi:hypothetical protein